MTMLTHVHKFDLLHVVIINNIYVYAIRDANTQCTSAPPSHLFLMSAGFIHRYSIICSSTPPRPSHSYYFNDDRLMHRPGTCKVIMVK